MSWEATEGCRPSSLWVLYLILRNWGFFSEGNEVATVGLLCSFAVCFFGLFWFGLASFSFVCLFLLLFLWGTYTECTYSISISNFSLTHLSLKMFTF